MSYLNRTLDPRRRNGAIIAVIAIHAAVGYGLVTGLSFTKLIERIDNPDGVLIDDVPLPQPTPTETPAPQQETVTYIAPDPRPPIDLAEDPPTNEGVETDQAALTLYPGNREAEFPPRPTTPTFTPRRAVPSNASSSWITSDDYPRRALVDEVEGSVAYRLVINTAGRVASCELTRASGNRALDDATCRLITNRARFEPATDERGAKVLGTFTGSVRWDIPE